MLASARRGGGEEQAGQGGEGQEETGAHAGHPLVNGCQSTRGRRRPVPGRGVLSGMLAAVTLTDVQMSAFIDGVRLGYDPFQVTYSLIKSTLFGAAIAYLCTFEGYVTQAGAEGVGKATAKAVVISSIWILVLDAVTAILLAPYLQG